MLRKSTHVKSNEAFNTEEFLLFSSYVCFMIFLLRNSHPNYAEKTRVGRQNIKKERDSEHDIKWKGDGM